MMGSSLWQAVGVSVGVTGGVPGVFRGGPAHSIFRPFLWGSPCVSRDTSSSSCLGRGAGPAGLLPARAAPSGSFKEGVPSGG